MYRLMDYQRAPYKRKNLSVQLGESALPTLAKEPDSIGGFTWH